MSSTSFELDHLFIWTQPGAPAVDRLVQAGFTEGEPNVHPGQGTANRRIFFQNAYLEFLWVTEAHDLEKEPVRATRLGERWSHQGRGASPFGICLRPAHAAVADLPFPSWPYRPPYLPPPLAIAIADPVPLPEPWWAYLPFARRIDQPGLLRPQPFHHANGANTLAKVRIAGPFGPSFGLDLSPAAQASSALGLLSLHPDAEPLLELWFEPLSNVTMDLRPHLPLRCYC